MSYIVLSLESLLVRSNRISMCHSTVLSLESLLVRQIEFICVVLYIVLCLESLLVRSNRIYMYRIIYSAVSGISTCTVKTNN